MSTSGSIKMLELAAEIDKKVKDLRRSRVEKEDVWLKSVYAFANDNESRIVNYPWFNIEQQPTEDAVKSLKEDLIYLRSKKETDEYHELTKNLSQVLQQITNVEWEEADQNRLKARELKLLTRSDMKKLGFDFDSSYGGAKYSESGFSSISVDCCYAVETLLLAIRNEPDLLVKSGPSNKLRW